MRISVSVLSPDQEDSATFEVHVTHFDQGNTTGLPEDCYPAELEYDVESVTINDGPTISPVPDDILAAYASAIDSKIHESIADYSSDDGYDFDEADRFDDRYDEIDEY